MLDVPRHVVEYLSPPLATPRRQRGAPNDSRGWARSGRRFGVALVPRARLGAPPLENGCPIVTQAEDADETLRVRCGIGVEILMSYEDSTWIHLLIPK